MTLQQERALRDLFARIYGLPFNSQAKFSIATLTVCYVAIPEFREAVRLALGNWKALRELLQSLERNYSESNGTNHRRGKNIE